MTREEIAKAINDDEIVRYNGSEYRVVGYKVLKHRGKKEYYMGILDLKNERTVLWIGTDDID